MQQGQKDVQRSSGGSLPFFHPFPDDRSSDVFSSLLFKIVVPCLAITHIQQVVLHDASSHVSVLVNVVYCGSLHDGFQNGYKIPASGTSWLWRAANLFIYNKKLVPLTS